MKLCNLYMLNKIFSLFVVSLIFSSCEGGKKNDDQNILLLLFLNSNRVVSNSVVTTIAGSVTSGLVDGTGTSARFNAPYSVAVDSSGNIFVADFNNNCIRRVTSSGVVTTIAGSTTGVSGFVDSTIPSSARFNQPRGIALDSSGNIYVSERMNRSIRVISGATNSVTTLVNRSNSIEFGPNALIVDSSGNIFATDDSSNSIRRITSAGAVTTIAGPITIPGPFSVQGPAGFVDGTGSSARFNNPTGIALDSSGNLVVADSSNNAIRRITSSGVVTTIAGSTSGTSGSANGAASAALFNSPVGIAIDNSGNIYVSDTFSNTIRRISSSSIVTTIAGDVSRGDSGFADGIGFNARFWAPRGLALDGAGNLIVADSTNYAIRRVVP